MRREIVLWFPGNDRDVRLRLRVLPEREGGVQARVPCSPMNTPRSTSRSYSMRRQRLVVASRSSAEAMALRYRRSTAAVNAASGSS